MQHNKQERGDVPEFADLDQAQKDAAYNNSMAVSDSPARLQDWDRIEKSNHRNGL